jgi:imidazolonepropionase-like amidohydrolase
MFMCLGPSLGSVERGKLADLVLLDANPLTDITNTRRINAVIVGGRMLGKKELQVMMDKLAAKASATK